MNSMIDSICEQSEVKILLNLLKLSDSTTCLHSLRVAELMEDMLQETGCTDEEEKREIITGALLHDIGKIFIPFNLQLLNGPLSKTQRAIIELHPVLSYEIVKETFSQIVQNICYLHHRYGNEQGYPDEYLLQRRNSSEPIERELPWYIPLIQVADVYDALVSPREYKVGYDTEKAFEIIERDVRKSKLTQDSFDILKKCVKNA